MDTDDLTRMLVEISTGQAPSLRTPEADALRAQLTRECAAIIAQGGAIDIPPEIPG